MTRPRPRPAASAGNRARALALVLTLALSGLPLAPRVAAAAPVHKCTVNGSVQYQQSPCPSKEARHAPSVEALNAERKKHPAPPRGAPAVPAQVAASPRSPFTCDGRTHCAQMTSCAEATHFLSHCPGVQMDGDGDGIPCEEQFCKP